MVFNITLNTFNYILAVDFIVDEAGVSGENHRQVTDKLSSPRLDSQIGQVVVHSTTYRKVFGIVVWLRSVLEYLCWTVYIYFLKPAFLGRNTL